MFLQPLLKLLLPLFAFVVVPDPHAGAELDEDRAVFFIIGEAGGVLRPRRSDILREGVRQFVLVVFSRFSLAVKVAS